MSNRKIAALTSATGIEVYNFSQEKAPIRVRVINNVPWFVAKDVCAVLEIAKHRDAMSRLDDDERGSALMDTPGGSQAMAIVNESGLYHLIFQSRKPEARKFRKWVTSEVLPSIRKKGCYVGRKSQVEYVDARDIVYNRIVYNGCYVRCVELDGVRWYSINDINRGVGSRTESTQSVKRLNARRTLTAKILLYGMTQPGWFTTELGVKLMLCSSQKAPRQLAFDFSGGEVSL